MNPGMGFLGKTLLLCLSLLLLFSFNASAGSHSEKPNPDNQVKLKKAGVFKRFKSRGHFLPAPPKRLVLCGEKVPLDQVFVAEQLDREFNIAVHDRAQVVMWMKRARRFFPYISGMLKKQGLPDDLKYLAVAESALLQRVSSHAGAVGLWQFMRRTGQRYGLRRNRWFDDRRNPQKATKAAVAYLKELHEEFGAWSLAMAAYNCGERRVRTAIKEQGTREYYYLYLPRETMRYVYRIMAAKIILSDPMRYGYDLPDSRLYKPWPDNFLKLRLKNSIHLRELAKLAGTSVRMLKELNPELRTFHLPRGVHRIRVPEAVDKVLLAKFQSEQQKKTAEAGDRQAEGGSLGGQAGRHPDQDSQKDRGGG
jgi:membrane-bound lytic murein transglycosylase D